jgi:tRNA-binding protein
MPTFSEFQALDIRVGTVRSAQPHPTARKPSIQLEIDFGAGGIRRSSAQLTRRYTPETLVGRQVVAVLNFPPRKIAGFTSEVLVLGAMPEHDDVILLAPDQLTVNGARIG